MDSVGKRIKAIRKGKGLTQQEFSNLICVSQAFLSMVEHDKENPSKAIVRLTSILFDVKEDWIINGTK